MENIWYVGSGGLDIRDPEGGETRFYGPDDVRIMAAFRDQLALRTSRMEGTRVDLSGPTLTLHYRRVSPADIPIVLEAFRSVAQLAGPMVMTLHSPGVIEARVRSARDERSAVRFIRRHLKPGTLIFYFGRNSRVQEALRDLHPSAMVVESGITTSSPSGYSVPDSSALFEVLTRLAGEWSKCRTERPASEGPAGSDS
jgi:trehalose-6-phosphatase